MTEKRKNNLEWLKKYKRIVVETDNTNPVTVAVLKPDKVEVTDGYRVRMKPNGEN